MSRSAFAIVAALAAVSVVSVPVTAQDSARVRRASTDIELQVSRLARELVAQQVVEQQLVRLYEEFRRKADQEANEEARQRSRRTAELMEVKVQQAFDEQRRLRRELETVCRAREKPDGWFGVALQGDVTVIRTADGADRYRYSAHPTVVTVDPGSPADKAGIRAQDVLVAIAGRDLRVGDVIAAELLRPGAKVPVTVVRDGDRQRLIVDVTERPETFEMTCPWVDKTIAQAFSAAPTPAIGFVMFDTAGQRRVMARAVRPTPAPSTARARGFGRGADPTVVYPYPSLITERFAGGTSIVAGAQLVQLNEDLGQAFGVSEGMLVLRVVTGTPAQKSGLRGGDVLLKANDEKLISPRALARVIDLSSDGQVKLTILRLKQQQVVTLRW